MLEERIAAGQFVAEISRRVGGCSPQFGHWRPHRGADESSDADVTRLSPRRERSCLAAGEGTGRPDERSGFAAGLRPSTQLSVAGQAQGLSERKRTAAAMAPRQD
jgi:hypothetical protein